MTRTINTIRRHWFVSAFLLLAAASGGLVRCQFLQPQSHLGRLVQSITSPLVLSGYARDQSAADSYDSDAAPAAGLYGADEQAQVAPGVGVGQQQQQAARGQQQPMQQAPSQQRGIPQHYYGAQPDDSGASSSPRHAHEYQMGAYLGPTIDDKEINGAFNSNDERDDDEGPAAGYGGPPAAARQRAAHSQPAASPGPYYGPGAEAGAAGAYGPPADDDDSAADEDDAPVERPGRGRAARHRSTPMSGAASQYRRQRERGPRAGPQHQLVAAANGYAPYGFAGPLDLNGLVAAAQGDPSAGYQVYGGADAAGYPGQGYYRHQGAGRGQTASANNPYGYGYGAGPAGQQQQRGARGDNDEPDADNDDD